jgi:RNA polymerase sigma-70 factor (ECF subfamily)
MVNINDVNLVGGSEQGKRKKFNSFFETFTKPIFYYAQKILEDPIEAEDVHQEAFEQLWKQIATIESEAHAKAFLFKVTRNKCLNIIRHKKVVQKHEMEFIYQQPTEEDLRDLFEAAETETIFLFRLRNGIDDLPPKLRALLNGNLYEGKSKLNLANTLKIKLKTVKNLMSMAQNILRKKFKP